MRKYFRYIWVAPLLLVLTVGVYYIPPVHDRLAWRIDEARTRMKYFFNPPDQAVFQPGGGTDLTIETVIATTRAEYLMTLTPQATVSSLGTSTPQPGPTPVPTITLSPTSLSASWENTGLEIRG